MNSPKTAGETPGTPCADPKAYFLDRRGLPIQLTLSEFEALKRVGLLWEFYPNAPQDWGSELTLEQKSASNRFLLFEEANGDNIIASLGHSTGGVGRIVDKNLRKEMVESYNARPKLEHDLAKANATIRGLEDQLRRCEAQQRADTAEFRRLDETIAGLQGDKIIVNHLETQRRHYSRPPMRAVTGFQWVITDEDGHKTVREKFAPEAAAARDRSASAPASTGGGV